MFFEAFIDELEKIAKEDGGEPWHPTEEEKTVRERRPFGTRTTRRSSRKGIENLKSKIRPKEYEHRDESLAASEFIENVPSALGRMGRQDRGR